jgi:hypothetical protein
MVPADFDRAAEHGMQYLQMLMIVTVRMRDVNGVMNVYPKGERSSLKWGTGTLGTPLPRCHHVLRQYVS